MAKRKTLTLKQTKFLGKYLKDGNATKAVREAYPNVKSESAMRVMGSKLVANANVQAQIQEVMDKEGLTLDLVIRELKSVIVDNDVSKKTAAIRIACEVMGLIGSGGVYQQFNISESQSLPQISLEAIQKMAQDEKLSYIRKLLEKG